ncbi:ComEC/Rec2 family competence protein [Azospirillum sp. sgz302134]
MTEGLLDEDGAYPAQDEPRPGPVARALGGLAGLLAAERERWALWAPVGVGGGVALYFALPTEPPLWLGPSATILCLLALWVLRRRLGAVIGSVALLSVALGFAVAQTRTAMVAAPILTRDVGPAMVTGRVLSVERQPAGARMLVGDLSVDKLKPEATPAKARLRLPAKFVPPEAGTVVRMRAVLHPPAPPPEPGAFDFQRRAFFQGFGAVGFVLGTPEVLNAPPVSGWDVVTVAFDRARAVIAERVQRAIPDPVEASVTAALLNGEEVAIPEPVMDAFRNSGLAHLLSISGLHVGIAAGIVFWVVRALLALVPWIALRWPIKKIAAAFGIVSAMAYTMLVGAPVPTVRSVLMTGLIMGAVIADRSPLSMRLVAFAGIVTVLMEPEGMLGPSFQMSFAAVVALIAVFEVANPVLVRWRKGAGWLLQGLLHLAGIAFTSVIATLATTPYSLFHFQQVAFYGVLSNMVAIPVTSVWVMPWSLMAYLLMPFGLEAPALIAMNWGDRLVIWTAEVTAALPGAAILIPAMPGWGIGAVTGGGLWLVIWSGRWRMLGLVPIMAGMLSPALTPRPDILVTGDGTVMAVRTAEGHLSLSAKADGRAAETWLRRDGREGPADVWPPEGVSLDGRLRCDVLGCVYRLNGRTIALLRTPDALPEDCTLADAVIIAEPARGCRAPLVIDRWRLRREGAQALYVSMKGVRVQSVRDVRGDRPWTMPR